MNRSSVFFACGMLSLRRAKRRSNLVLVRSQPMRLLRFTRNDIGKSGPLSRSSDELPNLKRSGAVLLGTLPIPYELTPTKKRLYWQDPGISGVERY
jgi:hypothetical protein